ncbi:MAG: cysteine hydrolase [Leptolyngbyaceae cyanobacterium SL_5_9]|nr:cysteine hydrolase [Leptolyngbyaceae cyanobacterium SL_5_9]NJO75696.1 cysteine hydrolase [Leptolyngbyaceae cyanobacterium RM1_406_9]
MEQAFGLEIPQTLSEICQCDRIALLVYDMQIGILSQLPPERTQHITNQVMKVLEAARAAGVRVFFSRHLSLPVEAAGVFQLRMAMTWQRVTHVKDVKPWFLRDAPGFQLIPELTPRSSEVIFDKITMSAFEGTFLNIALRDCGINALIVVGVATEIGIEPTVRHAADMGYIPIVVTDACGGGDEDAAQRSIESLKFTGDAVMTDTETLCNLLKR